MGSQSLLVEILSNGKKYNRIRGQVVNTTSGINGFNLIISGYVKRYLIKPDGSLSVQSIYGPNNFFPINPVFEVLYGFKVEDSDQFYYECITPAVFHSISLTKLVDALDAYSGPELYKDLFAISGRRLQYHIHRLNNDALSSAYEKVAHQLDFLSQQFGVSAKDGIEIQMPLRHQDLADMLNMSRETVSKQLIKMQSNGAIHASRHLTITDKEKLVSIFS